MVGKSYAMPRLPTTKSQRTCLRAELAETDDDDGDKKEAMLSSARSSVVRCRRVVSSYKRVGGTTFDSAKVTSMASPFHQVAPRCVFCVPTISSFLKPQHHQAAAFFFSGRNAHLPFPRRKKSCHGVMMIICPCKAWGSTPP